MWWAPRTSGCLPTLLRARTPGSSASPATCGRNTCPNIAPLPSTTPGCLPTPDCSYCLHKLTSSMFSQASLSLCSVCLSIHIIVCLCVFVGVFIIHWPWKGQVKMSLWWHHVLGLWTEHFEPNNTSLMGLTQDKWMTTTNTPPPMWGPQHKQAEGSYFVLCSHSSVLFCPFNVMSLISDLSCVSTCSSPINAKKVNSLNSSDSYIGLWRNYLILCCSSASSSPSMCSSSSTSGSVRCSPPETLASTPDSGYSYDSKVRSTCTNNSLCTHINMVLNIQKIYW